MFGSSLLMAATASTSYTIANSVRFRSAGSTYLSRTPSVAGNRQKFTISCWVKRAGLSTSQMIFQAGTNGFSTNYCALAFLNTGELTWEEYTSAYVFQRRTGALLRDPGAWYHVVGVFDSANGTAADRAILYVNGSRVTSFSLSVDPTVSVSSAFVNNTNFHGWGATNIPNSYLDGYLSECYLIDGSALTPSSFGQTDANGVWVPKAPSGLIYGTNGVRLQFGTAAALGTDTSGNGNTYTSSGLATTDQMTDTPTNNHCTFNPLELNSNSGGNGTFSNGNLKVTGPSTSFYGAQPSIYAASGKFYFEATVDAIGPDSVGSIGIGLAGARGTTYQYNASDGTITGTTAGATYTTGAVVACALDLDGLTAKWYKNNVLQGTSTIASGAYGPVAFIRNTGAWTYNFGQRPFTYTPPTGHVGLCTANVASVAVTTSGTFTGNAAADGPFVYTGGNPTVLTINGNAATFGTHADKCANGFKLRTSSASYNTAGSNTWTATAGTRFVGNDAAHTPNTAQGNPQ